MAESRDIPDRRSAHPKMVRSMRIIVMSMIDDWDLGRRLIADGHEIVAWVVPESDAHITRRGPVLAWLIKLARVLLARNRPISSLRHRFDNRAWLAEREIAVMYVPNVNASDFIDYVRSNAVNLIVIAIFPQILRRELLSLPGLSAINYHPSPLPDYAGPQPTFWMIRNGETRAAITVHRVAEKVASGDILARQFVDILPEDTNGSLLQRLHHQAAEVLSETVNGLAEGEIHGQPQDPNERRYYGRKKLDDLEIDWSVSAQSICDLLRAIRPWEALRTNVAGRRIAIYAAHAVALESAHPPGEIVRKQGRNMVIQTGEDGLNVTTFEVEPYHGWMNRLVQIYFPRPGMRLVNRQR